MRFAFTERMEFSWSRLAAAVVLLLLPVPALACTLCQSAQAASIRDRLMAPDLWWNACAIILPLSLLLAVVALVLREPETPGAAE
jgi:predicted permease